MATSLPAQPVYRSGGWSILIGILLILAGLAAICLPFLAGVAVSIAVGWLLLIAGIIHLAFGWQTRSAGAVIWKRESATMRNTASAAQKASFVSADGPSRNSGGGLRSNVPRGMTGISDFQIADDDAH